MPKASDTPLHQTATAYFLKDNKELKQAELGSDVYNDLRNYGRLFVLSKPSGFADQNTISIPISYLEAIAPSELHNLNKITQKLSGSTPGSGVVPRFEVVGVAPKQTGKIAEKLLNELIELLKVQKVHRAYKHGG